jgi:AcrR family transcriptional regulator
VVDELPRPHTGRRRNEATRQAILDASLGMLLSGDTAITMDGLAAAARVSKQTIYRWWPTKAAVLAEALTAGAKARVPAADTGTVLGDLTAFLIATFRGANDPAVAQALRLIMAEAQSDPQAAEVLHAYTAERRTELRTILDRGRERGQLSADLDLDMVIDQAFGVVWYRLLVGHAPLTRRAAVALAKTLLR